MEDSKSVENSVTDAFLNVNLLSAKLREITLVNSS